MKKSTFLKLALVFVAIFVYAGAMAQYPATINTDYVQVTGTTYQTEGKTFRLYVAPDFIYSPSYDGTSAADLNTDSRWTWTYNYPLALVGTPAHNVVSAAQTNWVEFTTVVNGTYTVGVVESNVVTGCADGSAVTQTVEVIDAPTAVIGGTTANVNYTWTGASPYTDCLPTLTGTETVTVTITEDTRLPVGFRAYALAISQSVGNVLPDLATADGAPVVTTWNYTVAAKLKTGNVAIPGTHTWTPNTVGNGNSTYSFATPALAVLNNKPTRYTYTIATASDVVAGTGIVSAVSEKSDYNWVTNAAVAVPSAFGAVTSIAYIVLPAPVTGPIYHIANDFAY